MDKRVVKMGVIGLGRGYGVMSQVLDCDNVRLTAICDNNPDKLSAAEKDLKKRDYEGVTSYTDFDEILKGDFEAIFVATDAVCHVPFVVKALDAGKHVISEIPAVNSLEEARILKDAVNAHPELKYMAGENCFYWAFIQAWKEMYANGKFGQAVYAEAEYLHPSDYRKYKKENFPLSHWRTTLPAIKYLTHDLGPLLYIMDDNVVSVTCMESDVVYNPYKTESQCGVALFKTAKGAVIKILVNFGSFTRPDHNFRLFGTKGSIETDRIKSLSEAHSFAQFDDIPGTFNEKIDIPVTLRFPGEADGGHGGADRKMMLDFVKCIVEDTTPPIDVDMGIRISIPGFLAHESALQGGAPVEIPVIN